MSPNNNQKKTTPGVEDIFETVEPTPPPQKKISRTTKKTPPVAPPRVPMSRLSPQPRSRRTLIIIIVIVIVIIALVALAVWMYIPVRKDMVLNITLILGGLYVFFFLFAHFFSVLHFADTALAISSGNFLADFKIVGISFIGLFLTIAVTIGIIVIFSIRLFTGGELKVYEKFIILRAY